MSAQELCEVIRIGYDPPAALTIDEAHAAGTPVSLTRGEVGTTETQASQEAYRHDSPFSVTWTMIGTPPGAAAQTNQEEAQGSGLANFGLIVTAASFRTDSGGSGPRG